jgi:hypothetical protein
MRVTSKAASSAVIILAAAVSLWMRPAFPIYAMGFSVYDDFLFLRLADWVRQGEWLGPYDNLTHAKGVVYSIFIALSSFTGIPLKLAEHSVYLGCSLYFSLVVGRVFGSRSLIAALFVLLAFNPAIWAPDVGGRVVRENLYVSLGLWVVALAIRAFLSDRLASARDELRRNGGALATLGVVGALFWLTREEGLWLAPAVVFLAACWFLGEVRAAPPHQLLYRVAIFIGLPLLAFTLVVGAMNARNYGKYKVFRNNDFRSADFQGAYGALARIKHDRWTNHVVFPKDARDRAYAASPAARELKPYFEGEGGEAWRRVSCEQTLGKFCDQIHSGWFMWALREAVARAGHYENARAAKAFYERLASEINDACGARAIECGPPKASLIPPWREEFAGATLVSAWKIARTMAALGNPVIYVSPSTGDSQALALYQRLTRGPIALGTEPWSSSLRFRAGKLIAHAMVATAVVVIPLAGGAWLFLVMFRRGEAARAHIVIAALLVAVGMRVALLGFLDATSIPSDNALYPFPATPFLLGLVPCVAWLFWLQMRSGGFPAGPAGQLRR